MDKGNVKAFLRMFIQCPSNTSEAEHCKNIANLGLFTSLSGCCFVYNLGFMRNLHVTIIKQNPVTNTMGNC